ncbi:MAG: S8 family serine peptidase, partial [Nostocales cyanobacterium 94392]|nr:S8 family serine peptidase [Nostocales cyanobacterium 94392]
MTTDNSTSISLEQDSQEIPELEVMSGQLVELRAKNQDAFTQVGTSSPQISLENAQTATINVTYNGFTPVAQAAFQYAVDIWEGLIESSVPINIVANYTPLGAGTLGSAGPESFYRNFSGAPQNNTWYPVALANKLAGTDLDPSRADITTNFNSNFSNWYFGTDGNTPAGQYDFASVVLHELGHGLGFLGFMDYQSGQGSWGFGTGFPSIYDRFTVNGSNQSLINTSLFPNPSTALGNQLTSNNLFFTGSNAVAANSGTKPKLYAPSIWNPGSSYSHLDEATYAAGNPNSLMTPQLGTAEAIHHPGDITLGIFEDMGWTINDQPSLGEISGIKWNDLDGDGVRDSGEPGLQGWTIYLDQNQNGQLDSGETSTTTNANGNYSFTNLAGGTYYVAEVLQSGWEQTYPGNSSGSSIDDPGQIVITTTNSQVPMVTYGEIVAPDDNSVTPQTNVSGSLINIDDFRADSRFTGIDGNGFATVILDTGIDLNHPFFGSDSNNDGVADRIVYHYDFADGDADGSDVNGHGSNVSSIVASSNNTYTGMAPGADIIHLKVFEDNGGGNFGYIEQALQWVIANAATYNIASVNMSLGDSGNYTTPQTLYGIDDELAALEAMDIIVVSASGNDFYSFNSQQGVAYPSADPNSFSIGAVYDSNSGSWSYGNGATAYSSGANHITPFSQRDDNLTTVFAPGAPITGAGPNGGTVTQHGTSQASPHIAGIAVLAQQLAEQTLGRRLTVTEFNNLLVSTGVTINDGDDENDNVNNTGLNFKRVDVQALGEAILNMATSSDIHVVNLSPGQTVTDIDFGNRQVVPNGSISGTKWNDLDGDGVRDSGEPGLQGWTIYLDQNQNGQLDNGETSTTTNANGNYSFTGLAAGTYHVAEVLQSGWEQTYPGNGSSISSEETISPAIAYAIERASDLEAIESDELNATTQWVIGLAPNQSPDELAASLGANNLGETGFISNTFIFEFADDIKLAEIQNQLNVLESVEFSYPLVEQQYQTQSVVNPQFLPNDPLFTDQWHLKNTGQTGGTVGADANVEQAWNSVRGTGVVIGIVDDGLQYTHPDLSSQYLPGLSYDFYDNDPDPAPTSANPHGTAVGGVAAGKGNNGIGVSGSAPNASLSGLRLIAGPISGLDIANALTYQKQDIDIYNNSWGPGALPVLSGIDPLSLAALQDGVTNGRSGLGNIYIFSAGNGLQNNSNVNYNGFANSRYTIAVSAIDHNGIQSFYSEPGAPILVAGYSNGSGVGITTTDLLGSNGYNGYVSTNDYTNDFGGTSSAAPLVSGVVALMLEANPNLTWRDVQHILVETGEQNDSSDSDWTTNGAGHLVNHKYGFGAIDALAAVNAATTWTTVEPEVSTTSGEINVNRAIPDNNFTGISNSFTITDDINIEWVEVVFDANHTYRGDLEVVLTSPDGTESILAEPHIDSNDDYKNWVFTSARHWGESSLGDWTLRVSDEFSLDTGTWNSWEINLYGTANDTPPAIPGTHTVNLSPGQTVTNLDFGNRLITENDSFIGETGSISNLTHTARTINLSRNYQNPVIFAQPLSFNGTAPATVRLDDITSNSFTV